MCVILYYDVVMSFSANISKIVPLNFQNIQNFKNIYEDLLADNSVIMCPNTYYCAFDIPLSILDNFEIK